MRVDRRNVAQGTKRSTRKKSKKRNGLGELTGTVTGFQTSSEGGSLEEIGTN